MNFFILEKKAKESKARAGLLNTSHGIIETPVFMPVGTQGTVKAMEQRQLEELDIKIILGNTYHLYLRPGMDVINEFSGLHKFMNWNRAILTDSGGYQVFSLQDLKSIREEGVEFRSHIDGSKHFFTPEKVIEIQRQLGSDICMVLDECTPYPSTYELAEKSMELSLLWAERSKNAFDKYNLEKCHSELGSESMNTDEKWILNQVQNDKKVYLRQYLFGIGQGSMYPELRKRYCEEMVKIGFDGYAIGGLSVGEPAEIMYEMVKICTDILPEDKPRYLMGVGTPQNILEAIDLGIDMFDCVLPTRNARNGQLFTTNGKINIRNAKYKFAHEPIDENINCYASRNFSLGYMRHLFISNEILGLQLATQHNIAFYKWLTKTAREKILNNEFHTWKENLLKKMNKNDE
jgi:queuine tRNA-ribosyltransferase